MRPPSISQGNCYGCGVALQTDFPDVSGYVPADEYETKRQHRQLNGMMLCSRCSDLSHGRMVNAVAGQGGAKLSAGLITPSELREQLTRIRDEKVLVVKVVDVTDFHGSFLNRVRDVVGANPILLVLTKVDLLPRGTDLDALREWAANEVTVKRRLTLAGVVCVSSRRGVGMREAVGAMFAERKGRDVYVLGSANVGKSTLFNALTGDVNAEAANYPFCTIEPNVGVVSVPDERLNTLSEINSSEKTVPTSLEFVDIAGLVKGASKGEGLGNQFLANIRECDAIVHMVRCFENDDVIHVDASIDPVRDVEVIELELALADLQQVEKRMERAGKDKKTGKAPPEEMDALTKLQAVGVEPIDNGSSNDQVTELTPEAPSPAPGDGPAESLTQSMKAKRPRCLICLGWQRGFVSFLHLLDARLPPGSEVHILSEQTMKQRAVELESEGLALDGQGHATHT